MSAVMRVCTLSATTTPLAHTVELLERADPHSPLLWMRGGEGIVGIGEALRLTFRGPTRLVEAAAAWRELVVHAQVDDPVKLPGSGLVAFGTFAFADDSRAESVLIVPERIVGRRNGQAWETVVRAEASPASPAAPASPKSTRTDATPPTYLHPLTNSPGAGVKALWLRPTKLSAGDYSTAVSQAVARIEAGQLDKVVLARDLTAQLEPGSDLLAPLARLSESYPECWTFAIDGFLGASPETLVSVRGKAVNARVLAGTAPRSRDTQADLQAASALESSPKELAEHEYAVVSLVDALRPLVASLERSDPFTLKLPNVWHLASDISAVRHSATSSLDLAAALHPTAAVAGVPKEAAVKLITELEPFDRGRYAGPSGWIGATGEGEWAVSLRSAQVDTSGLLTAFAGAGIVAGSDPVLELAETTVKFRPIVDAFSTSPSHAKQ